MLDALTYRARRRKFNPRARESILDRRAAGKDVAVLIVAGRVLHLQMQTVAGEGMRAGQGLVDVDAEAGSLGTA